MKSKKVSLALLRKFTPVMPMPSAHRRSLYDAMDKIFGDVGLVLDSHVPDFLSFHDVLLSVMCTNGQLDSYSIHSYRRDWGDPRKVIHIVASRGKEVYEEFIDVAMDL